MEREDFINQILSSVDGITKVNPSDNLYHGIEQRITNETKISSRTLWLVAASIVVLISLNILLLNDKFKPIQSEMASLERSINKSNQLYK
ncbi:hypothetical protein [Flavobacterium sp.]|uniref:hypothetical protein n=1 Tax=Flavobacterium sp. TaxID=239 RepID=UPI0037516CD2